VRYKFIELFKYITRKRNEVTYAKVDCIETQMYISISVR